MLFFLLASCSSPATEGGTAVNTDGDSLAGMPFAQNSTIFEIDPAQSEARFLIDEIFNGEDKTVVGTTDQVRGQIGLDFDNPSTAAVGPIQVSAGTFATDSGFRDRAIQNRILLAGIYEFITFTPTAIRDLPQTIKIGEPVAFEIDGELKITTISKPVTFAVIAVPISESLLEASAIATINRNDFDLVIPSATGVAAVDEEVYLELNFAAAAAQ
jgi:polyisoprenoid-binding protein YceI